MSTQVAHHFDDAEQQFEAARLGMWVFLATEVLFFGGLFTGYVYYRTEYPAAFVEGSKYLDVALGTLNTAVLLTSSLTMVLAIHAIQSNRRRAAVRLLVATSILGATFLCVKGYEYRQKYVEHLVPGWGFAPAELHDPLVSVKHVELFLSFYLAMTGLHALHMIIGIGLVGSVTLRTWLGRFSPEYYTPIEITGLYWHFIDIVWVFLFPLLYLVR